MRSEKETPAGGEPGLGQKKKGDEQREHLPLQDVLHIKPKKTRLNRRKAILNRCLDCSGFSRQEVRECPIKKCPLYRFRLGNGKQDAKARDKAIRAYCRFCMNDQLKEVRLCPSEDCSLFEYRLTNTQKRHIGLKNSDKIAAEGDRPGGAYG